MYRVLENWNQSVHLFSERFNQVQLLWIAKSINGKLSSPTFKFSAEGESFSTRTLGPARSGRTSLFCLPIPHIQPPYSSHTCTTSTYTYTRSNLSHPVFCYSDSCPTQFTAIVYQDFQSERGLIESTNNSTEGRYLYKVQSRHIYRVKWFKNIEWGMHSARRSKKGDIGQSFQEKGAKLN